MAHPDERTLDEIYADDTEMTFHKIQREAKRYQFFDFTTARKFQREMFEAALKRMGMPMGQLHRLQQMTLTEIPLEHRDTERQIRVENRTYPEDEAWKAGIYCYIMNKDGSHGDLAYWVSGVFRTRENEILRSPIGLAGGNKDNTNKYYVMTNVPTDDCKRMFIMPLFGKN
jgi:hypothetical protein